MGKEEYAIILDYLPNGYPLSGKVLPLAQAVGESSFVLLELIPRKGVSLEIGQRVYIGDGKREEIYYINGRLKEDKLTEQAKEELKTVILKTIKEKESEFIKFFNESEAINKRVHQIELLPGFGKKHMKEILEKRKEKEFENFNDMKERIQNLPDPENAIAKRIIQELSGNERHILFT